MAIVHQDSRAMDTADDLAPDVLGGQVGCLAAFGAAVGTPNQVTGANRRCRFRCSHSVGSAGRSVRALCRQGFIEVFPFDYGTVAAGAFEPDALAVFMAYP
jgi:hypothetical protein